ncbi:MAG TPA: amidase family protein [Caulobacteraceae bacterium]|nr:amidase family protein [Caulobacteraceae bacterium]
MADMLSLDATGQLAALEARRIGAEELLDLALRRHAEVKGPVNAVVATDVERARQRARAADDLRARGGQGGLLAGLPMTVKDTFDVEGMPASSGLDALLHRKASDAVSVAAIRAAGAVVWGKTNTPVMAGDWQTYNALYGTTNNPWDLERTTGGSSGGSAAALATGVTALELGSDIGGSLRVPASFCGVFSHKPTWGMVSQIGHVPPAPGTLAERDLNVVGPMARSARDLRLLLSVIENGPLAPKAQPADLRGLKVGLWLDEPSFWLDDEVRACIETFAAELAAQGAEIRPMKRFVDAEALIGAYQVLLASVLAGDMPARAQAGLRRMGGLARLALKFGAARDGWAGTAAAYTATHAEWIAADEVRARAGAQMRRTFGDVEVILAPITPVVAFPHDHRPFQRRSLMASDGRRFPYMAMMRWIALATACGLPATAVPAGHAASGLPVGVQIIGPRGADSRTLAVAEAIDERLGGFTRPPPLTGA